MKILITGAGGKLAGEIARSFGENHELVYTARHAVANVPSGVLYPLDLAAPAGMEQIFAIEKPDAVIHLGALLPAACQADPEQATKVNIDATAELARLAIVHNVRSFILASTAAVYSQTELRPVTETEAIVEPRLVYGQTKLAAEREIAAIAETGNTRFTALRIFNIYGNVFTDSLIYKLVHSTKDTPVGLVGPDTFVRDYVHVDDVVKAHEQVLAQANAPRFRVYNIASGVPTSNGGLLEQLVSQGVRPYYTMKPIDLNVTWADISRAKQELGFDPRTSIIVG